MRKQNIIVFFFTFVFFSSIPLIPAIRGQPDAESRVMRDVNIDGIIEDDEWRGADHRNIGFHFNVNESDGNVDGMNYLSVGEDENNVYIALDLCSNRIDDKNGEWLGMWLDTNQNAFDNKEEWSQLLNNGTEDMVYDMDNDQEYTMFKDATRIIEKNFGASVTIDTLFGTQEGDLKNYEPPMKLTSNNDRNASKQEFKSEFTVDMSAWSFLWEELRDEIREINITMDYQTKNMTADTELYFTIDDNAYNLSESETDIQTAVLPLGMGNVTEDDTFSFSVYGSNESADGTIQLQVYSLKFDIEVSEWNHPMSNTYPHTSLSNYTVEWGFNSSSNGDINHRMVEIAIPKSQLELYDTEKTLGVFFMGGGSLELQDGRGWYMGSAGSDASPYSDFSYIYLEMHGVPEKTLWDVIVENAWLVIGAIAASVGSIFAFIGLGIIKRRKDDEEWRKCDPNDLDCNL